jgi:CCR4-NOT transcription complex subunit 2
MVKQPTSEQSEFTMSSEDFPALPGTSSTGAAPAGPPAPTLAPDYNHTPDKPRKGIHTSPDGQYPHHTDTNTQTHSNTDTHTN